MLVQYKLTVCTVLMRADINRVFRKNLMGLLCCNEKNFYL